MQGQAGIGKKHAAAWIGTFLLCLAEAACLAPAALADSISALLEFDYTNLDTETRDKATGEKTVTDTSSWGQLYNLNLEKSFFPNLTLRAGGIYEITDMDTELNGTAQDSKWTKSRPYVDLTLDNRLYRASVGYSKRDDRQEIGALPTITSINELSNAIFDWRPEGLPSFDLRFSKSDLYDRERVFQDTTTTTSSLNSRYFTERFDLRYNPIVEKHTNRIDDFVLETTTHNGRLSYTDTFFDRRSTFSATYNITDQQQKIDAHGQGALFTQIAGSGLYRLNTPSVTSVALDPLVDLTNGDRSSATIINLGTGNSSTEPIQIGLDFGTETTVNSLRLWVAATMPANVAAFFSWDVYSSSDNISWQLEQTVAPASFDPFQNYFEINFTDIAARYIKVVVGPLRNTSVPPFSADPLYDEIRVTEIQAFTREPLPDKETKLSSTSQIINLDARTMLTERYNLFHDISFFLTKKSGDEGERSTLSNVLSANHRFHEKLLANARLVREDINNIDTSGYAHGYSASLRLDPLKTLNNTLLVTGRQERIGDDELVRNSLFLQNRAALYTGIDAFVDGGVSWQDNKNGRNQEALTLNMGTSIVPHRAMTISATYRVGSTDFSGGNLPDDTERTSRTDIGMTWRPFQTVYLVASYGRVELEDRNDTLKNYSVNWSPFPYGTLQLQMDYGEELHSEDLAKRSTFRASVSWEVVRRVDLSLYYYKQKNDSLIQATELESFNADLKIRY